VNLKEVTKVGSTGSREYSGTCTRHEMHNFLSTAEICETLSPTEVNVI